MISSRMSTRPSLRISHNSCLCRREVLAPLQQAEAIDIRRKSDAFGEKVEDFRKFFQQKAPFSVPGGELKLEHVSGSVYYTPAQTSAIQASGLLLHLHIL